ncbi:unnamed protein product [Ilex paraguariensis]|uniref:PPM-type phosphatase domain-containing protein n=1 Tax=Ilex paraguariensis TaxID=185542 RepID=A0ABC8TW98_9AQUA
MGSGFSHLFPCFNPAGAANRGETEVIFTATEPLDETLGHSFCYVRSSNRFLSPTHSDRFLSPSQSLRFDEPLTKSRTPGPPETGFKAISGASVSANTSTPRTVLQLEHIYDDINDSIGGGVKSSIVNGFESTSSFSSLPLQPVPRASGGGEPSGPMERGFFMSGPIERGAVSGPLDGINASDGSNNVPFSAPLGGMYVKRRRKKGISGIRKAFNRNFSEKKRPWVVPVLNFVGGRKDVPAAGDAGAAAGEMKSIDCNVQWALGKAGEDRVHVVVSEEHGWLFVGIYDGFNGPDAPEFLMGNLYKAVYNALEGLFWDNENKIPQDLQNATPEFTSIAENSQPLAESISQEIGSVREIEEGGSGGNDSGSTKKVTFQNEGIEIRRRRRLWEFLAEDDAEDGLDLSGSERFAFSVDDALSVSNGGSAVSRRSLLLSKLKHGLLTKNKENKLLFPWRFGLEGKEKQEVEENKADEESSSRSRKTRKMGPVDHELVLRAMSRALELTEIAYLDMTDKVLDRYPELALMGSCLLVVLMRDDDVYVMNLGDSRAIVAQDELDEVNSSTDLKGPEQIGSNVEGIVEESMDTVERANKVVNEASAQVMRLTALQLSTDHSTSIEEMYLLLTEQMQEYEMILGSFLCLGRTFSVLALDFGFETVLLYTDFLAPSISWWERHEVYNGLVGGVDRCPISIVSYHPTEVIRIRNEHPDDSHCIVNDRVKGRLKVTRAFGAGSLKQPKLNDALLEMFRNEYIGTAPYISCLPSLRHHKLGPRDQFLVLSSDGLYQYLSNQEVVSHVESFMEKFPDGDPAQHLIEELLFRAAKKAGMDFHELLDIPQGDRRKYHDDVTVMVISLEGRIWKSSGKYL